MSTISTLRNAVPCRNIGARTFIMMLAALSFACGGEEGDGFAQQEQSLDFNTSGSMQTKVSSTNRLPCGGSRGRRHSNGGGFVASTASVHSYAYVGTHAQVCGFAKVLQNARIREYARIDGFAQVGNGPSMSYSKVTVEGHARISGNALVQGRTTVSGSAKITHDAKIVGPYKTLITGTALVAENARIESLSWYHPLTMEGGQLLGHAKLKTTYTSADMLISGSALIDDYAEIRDNVSVDGNAKISGHSKVFCRNKLNPQTANTRSDVRGDAKVDGIATIECSQLSGSAKVLATPTNYNSDPGVRLLYSTMYGNAQARDNAYISKSTLRDFAIVGGSCSVEESTIRDHAMVSDWGTEVKRSVIAGNASIETQAKVHGTPTDSTSGGLTRVEGDAVVSWSAEVGPGYCHQFFGTTNGLAPARIYGNAWIKGGSTLIKGGSIGGQNILTSGTYECEDLN
jgi:carbonic anhydrase/acetyltransferase-like protein (isoleucine patch superfamily)